MERSSKRMRMSAASPHPLAVLLGDAFRAFFTKRETKKRPKIPPQPFNILKELKQLNRYVETTAKHPDASVYSELPYDVQGLVRKFTPHPISLLVEDAHDLWRDLKRARSRWPHEEAFRIARAERIFQDHVTSAHFDWLQDRGVLDAWVRSGVTCEDLLDSGDEGDWESYNIYGFDPYAAM